MFFVRAGMSVYVCSSLLFPLHDAGDSCEYPVVGVHEVALRMLARAGPYVYLCLFYPVSFYHLVGM